MNNYIKKLQIEFKDIPDLIIKKINISLFSNIYIVFLETLSSQDKINEYILKKVTSIRKLNNIENSIPGGNIKKLYNYDLCEYYLFNGYTLLIKNKDIYAIETKADITRNVSTNETEPSIKGPKDAFTENYQVNLGLIKRRIKSSKLKTKSLSLGRLSNSSVAILYIDSIVKLELVNKVYDILNKIDIDLITDSENITKYFKDKSLFPTVVTTERPDRCASALCEGKVVVIVDGSPNALILPSFLLDIINPYTDKYSNNKNINFTKTIRLLCFFLSAIVPAFYIAIINFNQEAIPTSLIVNFAIQRDQVPFPAFIECIIMLIICEILRESDLRFPNKYGSAISILGALVLGDAAVSAGLVSPIMIIITAFTYISSLIFAEIEIDNALRYYRFACLLASSVLGLYGLLLMIFYFIINLCDIKSIGYPYMFPISPFDKNYFKSKVLKMRNDKRSKVLSNNIIKENL